MNSYLLLILVTLLGAGGAFYFKKATNVELKFMSLIVCIPLYVGGLLYFMSAVLNIYVLKYLPYTIVLPMTSITYIWTMVIAQKYFDEKIGIQKIIGVVLILFGAISISMS